MFETRLRGILLVTAGLFSVFLCRTLYLQTAGAGSARESIEARRHGVVVLPPRRGTLRDVDGLLLAADELGFDLVADTRSLGARSWECPCGRVVRTYESDPGPGPDDLPPLPADAPASCRCGRSEFRSLEEDPAADLAALAGLTPEEMGRRLSLLHDRGWRTARCAARHRPERWRRLALHDWLGRRRKVAGHLTREAALEIALAPDRFPGLAVEARSVRRAGEGLDGATLALVGSVGPALAEDEARLRQEGLSRSEIRSLQVGRSGVERAFDRELRGSFGAESAARDLRGAVLSRESLEPVVDGETLRLTCSASLNAAAERFLGGRPGAVLAMDPRTGAIRALAGSASAAGLVPGSVMKVLTGLVAVEGGVEPAAGEVPCSGPGSRLVSCEHDHGRPGFRDALAHSCNAYFGAAALRIGVRPLEEYARRLHLDRPFGIGLAAEGGGTDWIQEVYPGGRPWERTDLSNVGIGQGPILLSPLQVGALLAAVANGGRPLDPHLVEGRGREPGAPAFSPDTLRRVREGLEDVVRVGTADEAGLQPFRCAGKTGTAQVAGGRVHSWFAGYAPAEDPRIVVVVVLADRERTASGGRVAAPVAASFLEAWAAWSAGR